MGLELKKGSKWWYGRWMRDGKRHFSCLKVEAVGKPGEEAFEASKKEAQEAFEKVLADFQVQKRPEDLVQEIHRVKYGRRIGNIPLSGLYDAWKAIPRKRQPKTPYVNWAKRTFERLLAYVATHHPRVKDMAAVDRKVAEGFMRAEEKRKVSPKTYNAELILLRGAFEHLREDAGMVANPFGKLVTKDQETFHRKPFTPEELKAIVDAAQDDDLMRPLIIVGVCTAMRRGDACLLRWEAVDLKNGFVTVKTSKTGETVEIPMLPMLREELGRHPQRKSGFIFPELAAIYQKNPDGINWRLGKIFEACGFINEEEIKDRNEGRAKAGLPPLEIDRRADVHADRGTDVGLRTVNIRGFHSFRVTWITMALAAGVPMELVRRVTGHKAADVVLKNYFKPGRAEFSKLITGAMPAMMLGEAPEAGATYTAEPGPGETLEKALEALDGMTAKTWKAQRDVVAGLVKQAKEWVDGRVVRETAKV